MQISTRIWVTDISHTDTKYGYGCRYKLRIVPQSASTDADTDTECVSALKIQLQKNEYGVAAKYGCKKYVP